MPVPRTEISSIELRISSSSTHELVQETAEMARALDRPLATVEQAPKMIGL
jgi:hypothetical protein